MNTIQFKPVKVLPKFGIFFLQWFMFDFSEVCTNYINVTYADYFSQSIEVR